MNINTGIIDMNGVEITLGMYLQNVKCKYLTYEVRIRNNEFVIHTGGSYRRLMSDDAFNNLKIITPSNIDILGLGANLYYTNLSDI